MAIVTNTVEYVFDTRTTSLTAATRYDFSSLTLYIPENTSRTFLSAEVEISIRDTATASGVYVASPMIGIKLGATAFDDSTETIGNYNEFNISNPQTFIFTRDVTTYFNSNFGSGTSQTCQVGVQFANMGTINITAKLILTYSFDDSAQTTRIKTVRIPMDGATGNLTNTLTELGTNQVPLLDTFLPESTKTYRNIWFEISGNERSTTTTDFTLGLALDSESEVNDGNHEQAQNGSPWYKFIWVRNSMTTSSAHAFKIRTTVTDRMNLANVMLYVTYEYDHSASTSIMNSLVIPLQCQSSPIGRTTSSSRTKVFKKFFIQENNISLKQSGIIGTLHHFDNDTIGNLYLKCGNQSYRTYTPEFGTTFAESYVGMHNYIQRIDSGGAQGAGITLSRGENTFTLETYTTGNYAASYNSYCLYLNYTSDKMSGGANSHNHSICHTISKVKRFNDYGETTADSIDIPETNFYVTSVGLEMPTNKSDTDGSHFSLAAELLANEGGNDGYGWTTLSAVGGQGSRQACQLVLYCDVSDKFQRHMLDPDERRLAIESSRRYLFSGPVVFMMGARMWITYHTQTYTIGGYVTGYSGGGSGIEVRAYLEDTREHVTTATTVAGGGFTATWYDNTKNIFCEAIQDSTRKGRSINTTAV